MLEETDDVVDNDEGLENGVGDEEEAINIKKEKLLVDKTEEILHSDDEECMSPYVSDMNIPSVGAMSPTIGPLSPSHDVNF